MESFCALTGLKIFTIPEWTRKKVSDSFTANFFIIGNSIIYSAPEGKADLEGVQGSDALKKEVAKYVSNGNGPYIQIQDYSALKGFTQDSRNYFAKSSNQDNRLLALFFCNLSFPLSLAVKIGSHFNTTGKKIYIAKHYKDAIKQALGLCAHYNLTQDSLTLEENNHFDNFNYTLSPVELTIDDDWCIQSPHFSVRYGIIDKCILHSWPDGYLTPEHVPLLDRIRHECQSSLPQNHTLKYFVVNSSKLHSRDCKARINFVQSVKDWHQQFPIRMYILYGVNNYMYAAMNLANPFVPFKIKIVKDFNEAFDIIRKDKIKDPDKKHKKFARECPPDSAPRDVIKLLSCIGSIDWEHTGFNSNINVEEQDPFSPVFQSIRLIKDELDYRLDELKKTSKDLQDKNTRLNKALEEIKTLRGVISICSYCKKIRNDKGAWEIMEAYITQHTAAEFSHGVCPNCYSKVMNELDKH